MIQRFPITVITVWYSSEAEILMVISIDSSYKKTMLIDLNGLKLICYCSYKFHLEMRAHILIRGRVLRIDLKFRSNPYIKSTIRWFRQ
jgi:hypothetical protein